MSQTQKSVTSETPVKSKAVYVVLVSHEHYDSEEQYQGSSDHIQGIFSTRQKAEALAQSFNDSSVEEFILDSVIG